jgi:hypothetical protein
MGSRVLESDPWGSQVVVLSETLTDTSLRELSVCVALTQESPLRLPRGIRPETNFRARMTFAA